MTPVPNSKEIRLLCYDSVARACLARVNEEVLGGWFFHLTMSHLPLADDLNLDDDVFIGVRDSTRVYCAYLRDSRDGKSYLARIPVGDVGTVAMAFATDFIMVLDECISVARGDDYKRMSVDTVERIAAEVSAMTVLVPLYTGDGGNFT